MKIHYSKVLSLAISVIGLCLISCFKSSAQQNGVEDNYLAAEMARTDSLMSVWYEGLRLDPILDAEDTERFTTNVPDSVLIERLEKMNSFITLPFNSTVKNYMVTYAEKSTEKMARILGLSGYYFPIFEEILDRYGLPLELKYMAIIESSLNPVARSRAGALGIWQFMFQTAKLYGLNINSFVDERLDVERAADAAARYLLDAYNTFGDWNLAICSYNCGAGNVNKAIRRAGGSRDFWTIYPYLPRETRGYVPAFVGAMYAMTYYKEYGIIPNPAPMPAQVDTFYINRNLHFKQLTEMLGVPLDMVRELNPQYKHDIIPGNEGTYILKLPYNYSGAFIDNIDSLYNHKADELMSEKVMKSIKEGGDGESIRYKVKEGDYLGKIANKYHVTVSNIKRWNNLKSNTIRIGQTLVIYSGNGPATQTAAETKAVETPPQTSTDNSGNTVYTVKSGDTLYSIAKYFPGISANDIMTYNGISSAIKPGMVIKIPTVPAQ